MRLLDLTYIDPAPAMFSLRRTNILFPQTASMTRLVSATTASAAISLRIAFLFVSAMSGSEMRLVHTPGSFEDSLPSACVPGIDAAILARLPQGLSQVAASQRHQSRAHRAIVMIPLRKPSPQPGDLATRSNDRCSADGSTACKLRPRLAIDSHTHFLCGIDRKGTQRTGLQNRELIYNIDTSFITYGHRSLRK